MNTEETLNDLYELRYTENDTARKYTLYRRIEESIKEKDKEIERLHSIIKEVREYIKKGIYSVDGSYILKILDKVDKE